MPPYLLAAAAVVAAYLVGGIPSAYIMGRVSRGIDIREHGSGNVGATNAWRVLGPPLGVAVFALDAAKGAAAVGIAKLLVLPDFVQTHPLAAYLPILCAVVAILGHTYTPYLAFKGGKGIATAAGALLVVTPWAIVILTSLFFLLLYITSTVSKASVIVAVLYPPTTAVMYRDVPGAVPFALLAATLVIWRHRSNIGRILRGEERRVDWGLNRPKGGA